MNDLFCISHSIDGFQGILFIFLRLALITIPNGQEQEGLRGPQAESRHAHLTPGRGAVVGQPLAVPSVWRSRPGTCLSMETVPSLSAPRMLGFELRPPQKT